MSPTRSDGARQWQVVLTELAELPVTLDWEHPAWVVRWTDGPTREQLADRAAALSAHRIGSPLPAGQLRFSRHSSTEAVAIGWLIHGTPTPSNVTAARYAVDLWCEQTPYPQQLAGPELLTAARLLTRLGPAGSPEELVIAATPPLPPATPTGHVQHTLPGRVQSYRWPHKGPPAELLGPTRHTAPAATAPAPTVAAPAAKDVPAPEGPGPTCARCGEPLSVRPTGRPARYCSNRCRAAAFRRRRTTPDPTDSAGPR